MFKIAVLVSGGGTNLQSIIDHIQSHELTAQIVLVVSSNPNAYALERATQVNIPTAIINKKITTNPSDEILAAIQSYDADLIVLAGYMGILSGKILQTYHNRIINIHPSLIPKFCGKGMYGIHVHEAVISAKEKISGCTVHYVNAGIDTGKIIVQKEVNVLPDDTPESLAARILIQEHKILIDSIKKIILSYKGK